MKIQFASLLSVLCVCQLAYCQTIKTAQNQEIQKNIDIPLIESLNKSNSADDLINCIGKLGTERGVDKNALAQFFSLCRSKFSETNFSDAQKKQLAAKILVLVKAEDSAIVSGEEYRTLYDIYLSLNDIKQASDFGEKMKSSFLDAKADTDVRLMDSLYEMSINYHHQGNTKLEKEALLEVLGLDWTYLYSRKEKMAAAKDLYVQAAKNLIDLDRNSLSQLKLLSFYPSTDLEIGPYLDEAIKSAEKVQMENDAKVEANLKKN